MKLPVNYILMLECFVLGGGESRRFGEDKLLFPIKGKECIRYVLDALAGVCDRLAIVGKDGHKFSAIKDVEFVPDILTEQGALVGIYTALKSARTDKVLVVSGDMPLVKPSLVRYIVDEYKDPITIYCIRGRLYPLFGVYSTKILKDLETYLKEGEKKVMDFIERVGYNCIKEDEVIHLDPLLLSFINMNTKEDLKVILKNMGVVKLKVSGMTCEHCVNTVKRALMSVDGVSDVSVSLEKGEVEVITQKDIELQALKSAIEEWGYKVLGEV